MNNLVEAARKALDAAGLSAADLGERADRTLSREAERVGGDASAYYAILKAKVGNVERREEIIREAAGA